MKIVHFADLHLDRPFAWARHPVAARRRQALRDCLARIVAVAQEERAEAILCGGDLYEHAYAAADTGEHLRSVLGSVGVPVLLAPGNHDWLGPASLYSRTVWPANVHVFAEPRLEPYELAAGLLVWGGAFTSPTRTESFLATDPRRPRRERGGPGGAVASSDGAAAREMAARSETVAPSGELAPTEASAPSDASASGEAVAPGATVHLALFHGSATFDRPASGGANGGVPGAGHAPYAPFRAADLERCGFAHAFVGHYHQPADHDLYTYPGNPDPLEFGETGERGVVVAEIGPDGTVRRRRRTVALSAVHTIELDVSSCGHFQELRETVASRLARLSGIVRLDLHGELAPEVALDLEVLAQAPDGIDQLVVRSDALLPGYDFAALAAEPSVRGRFVAKVCADPSLDEIMRRRVLVTGLRALAGRDDLEAF